MTGTAGFRVDSRADIALVAAHLILPLSALLEFPIPVRIRKENIQRGFIFRQFVVHQLLFSTRSLWFVHIHAQVTLNVLRFVGLAVSDIDKFLKITH